MDWTLLRKQKHTLLSTINNANSEEKEDLMGILHLIDALQDEAVAKGEADEEEVFGSTDLTTSGLDLLIQSFISSQDNSYQDEYYATAESIAKGVMTEFKEFLASKGYAI